MFFVEAEKVQMSDMFAAAPPRASTHACSSSTATLQNEMLMHHNSNEIQWIEGMNKNPFGDQICLGFLEPEAVIYHSFY